VREAAGRLAHEQTAGRRCREHTPAPAFRDDGPVVGFRVEAEHAQLEAVLPLGLTVTAPRVAPRLRQQRDNLLLEGNRDRPVDAAHRDGHAHPLPIVANEHLG
jgi:hypothetical protein